MNGQADAAGPRLEQLLSTFNLTTAASEIVPRLTAAGHDELLPLLLDIFELERQDRDKRRVDRLRHASKLPPGKTLATFQQDHLPKILAGKLRELARGDFLQRAVNVLAFGLPGTGKSHAACAIGHALIEAGHSVLFTPTFKLVQELLVAKRDFQLPRALRKLDSFELLILDDLGYVQQAPEEIEVLFTLLAERYERRSLLITSNLVFSQWERIFKNPMTTAAAIDRLVHHCVILEFDLPSYRTQKTGALPTPAEPAPKPSTKRN
ncbi:MAG: IS21-like element helper ATPase IstB [Thermoanaerobaculia bacterium]|jgi:DNA replication protein DnaC